MEMFEGNMSSGVNSRFDFDLASSDEMIEMIEMIRDD